MIKIFRKTIEGQKRGRRIGFPTLNFGLKKEDKIKRGVWLVGLKAGGKSYLGAANVGPAKTFGNKEEKIEVHLFTPFRDKSLTGFTKPTGGIKKTEIYPAPFDNSQKRLSIEKYSKLSRRNKRCGIYFLRYLRKTKKFKTIEELKKQIKKDIKKARHFLMSLKDVGCRTSN